QDPALTLLYTLSLHDALPIFVLVIDGKAEILETHDTTVNTARAKYPSPSVIRLVYLIKRPRPRVKLTRREIFIRDNFTCQYCGRDRKSTRLNSSHVKISYAVF